MEEASICNLHDKMVGPDNALHSNLSDTRSLRGRETGNRMLQRKLLFNLTPELLCLQCRRRCRWRWSGRAGSDIGCSRRSYGLIGRRRLRRCALTGVTASLTAAPGSTTPAPGSPTAGPYRSHCWFRPRLIPAIGTSTTPSSVRHCYVYNGLRVRFRRWGLGRIRKKSGK